MSLISLFITNNNYLYHHFYCSTTFIIFIWVKVWTYLNILISVFLLSFKFSLSFLASPPPQVILKCPILSPKKTPITTYCYHHQSQYPSMLEIIYNHFYHPLVSTVSFTIFVTPKQPYHHFLHPLASSTSFPSSYNDDTPPLCPKHGPSHPTFLHVCFGYLHLPNTCMFPNLSMY